MKGEHKQGVIVQYLGGTRVSFTCPQGHISTKDFSKGKPSQRIGETGVRKMVGWWNDRITYTCKACKKGAQQ